MQFEEAKALIAALEREGVRYVLVRAMAMAVHEIIRATQDIDFFVATDDDNVERLKRALHSVFDDPSIDEIDSSDLAGAYPVIRYGPPGVNFTIDLIARLGDAFTFEDVESEEKDSEGVQVRTATPRMLYVMKRSTIRPQDRVDADVLRQRFGLDEEP